MKEALQTFDMTWLPITGLFIFITCFVAYVYWTLKKENKKAYDNAAMLPLQEDLNDRRN
jgi:cbb3-type cytochrome oxidase subunit 3